PITASLVSGPSHGSLALSADGSFLYTPDPGFRGIDTFLYLVSDPFGGSVQALATLNVGFGSGETLASFTLKITRPDGSPVTSLAPGDDFVLHVFTKDDHPVPHGVFAAYLDVTWDPTKAIATGPIQYSATYSSGHHALTAGLGLIDEGGGFSGNVELGGRSLEV